MTARSLLILGGTGEAAVLVAAVLERFGEALAVTTSLAGRTQHPRRLAGQIRIGGFGGSGGLADYLGRQGIDRLIDATHPFAARISHAARLACELATVPRLALVRPPWRRHPEDRWIEVDDMAAAAALVGQLGRRPWLTIGASEVAAFAETGAAHFLVRLVEPPQRPLPLSRCEVIVGRGPFTLAGERTLFARHAIDVLVTKASGGVATEAKLAAARQLGLPVIMVRRPPPEPGVTVETIDAALDWLAA